MGEMGDSQDQMGRDPRLQPQQMAILVSQEETLREMAERPKNFPPGPPPLPILGNLLNLSLDNPMRDFERLRRCYGNVYSLFLGPKPAVVINGVQAMKEAMMTKAADFTG
ncbi:cytochrome P450 2F2-like protein [Lates japonicus]|uniref:Cytochrome P450 2F2-like protein n=1 Tax=Lates japonicus TaxID=270547 RepID=A0AAD3RKV3_LATJO|nr:cytochrome P450 2F2-like protein [Lates japonicus]